jgi:NADPH:quinone reductase-like Zn-dependent oxidoreductase
VPGVDLAGVVERVGAGVDAFAAGDEVYGVAAKTFVGAGTFADYVAVSTDTIAPKPKSLDFAEAAAVPTAGLTALAAIEAAVPASGQTIVVLGATGGVGSFVTQLASARGATVVAVSAKAGTDLRANWERRKRSITNRATWAQSWRPVTPRASTP